MKNKANYVFRPQTGILIAGLLAASYAEACYTSAPSQAICFNAGDTVDQLTWHNGTDTKLVIATASWTHGMQSGGVGLLNGIVQGSGHNQIMDPPSWCYGSAKYIDGAGTTDTVPYWENNASQSSGITPPATPVNGGTHVWAWGELGSTC